MLMFSFPLERGVRTGWKTISSAIPAVPSEILSQYNHILHSRIRQRSKKRTGTKETGSGRLLLHIFRGIVVCGRRHFWYNFFIVLFHGLFWEGQRMYTTKKKRKTQQSTKRKEEDLEVSFFKQEKKEKDKRRETNPTKTKKKRRYRRCSAVGDTMVLFRMGNITCAIHPAFELLRFFVF